MSRAKHEGFVPLFFAFPDGVFHHVCAECNALCCRGGGFGGSMKREMPFLLRRYPALSGVVTGRSGDVLHFTNPVDRCFFLNGKNLCQIEVDHGKSKKPGICTVFPFNSFRRIGHAVAVSPHFACPLRLQLPSRPGEVEGTHKTLERSIRSSRLLEPAQVNAQMPDTRLHKMETASSVLSREKRFRDLCASALGQLSFRDVVLAESKDPQSLKRRVFRAVDLMRWDQARAGVPRGLDDILLAMASAFRIEALHLSSEDTLASLLIAEHGVLQACTIGSYSPSPQGVYATLQSLGPALRLLACGERFPQVPRSINKSPFGACELSFRYAVALTRMSKEGNLNALEKTFKDAVSPPDRKLIVQQLGIEFERLITA